MFFVLFLVASTWALDCTTLKSCETCAGQSQGFLICNWCANSSSCVSAGQCQETDIIEIAYDCPMDPKPGFEYNDTFARVHAFPLAGAAYSDVEKCMITANTGVNVTKVVELLCDTFNNTCKAYVGVNEAEKAVVLVARGSTNLQAIDEIIETFDANKDFIGGGKVHEYFYDAFDLLWNSGIQDELTKLRIQYPTYELWVTGHSLGGSLASLFAEMAVVKDLWKGENIKLITMGQPRTGDIVYAQNHDAKLPYSYRVVHAHDMIPHLVPKMGDDELFHHRYEVWYNNNMTMSQPYVMCNRPDDDTCSNTELDLSLLDHGWYFSYNMGDCCKPDGCPPR